MAQKQQEEKQQQQQQLEKEKYLQFWKEADANGDGALTIQELHRVLSPFGRTDAQIADIFIDIDKDKDGTITFDEFLEEVVNKKNRAEALLDLFKEYDADGNGLLSRDEIVTLVVKSGLFDDPKDAADKIIKQCDTDKDGNISFDEFKKACS